jgi:hypothetical protein
MFVSDGGAMSRMKLHARCTRWLTEDYERSVTKYSGQDG